MIDGHRISFGSIICGLAVSITASTSSITFEQYIPPLPEEFRVAANDLTGGTGQYVSLGTDVTPSGTAVRFISGQGVRGATGGDEYFLRFAAGLESSQTSLSAAEQGLIWDNFADLLS
jgi:hypothetical protein